MTDPVTDPQYRASGEGGLPKGSRQSLDQAKDFADAAPGAPGGNFDTAETPAQQFSAGDGNRDNLDPLIFAQTDFPSRPLTHGAPFGPGDNAIYPPRLSDRAMLDRAATRMLESKDSIPEEALVWAMRTLAGG